MSDSSIFTGLKRCNGARLPRSNASIEKDGNRFFVRSGHGSEAVFRSDGFVPPTSIEMLEPNAHFFMPFMVGLNDVVNFDTRSGGSAFQHI